MQDKRTTYCPGCSHGIIQRLLADALDKFTDRPIIGVNSVGCSVVIYNYLAVDFIQAPHGRAPAVATGVKRTRPDSIVFTYQGDGDALAIGIGELLHAAARGENITVIFVNNGVYGMTGGQAAPTTLPGQKTTTTPLGRKEAELGFPIDACSLLRSLPGVAYLARSPVHDVKSVHTVRRYIARALETQAQGLGFSFVEILAACPTNWRLDPTSALNRVKTEVVSYFPPGEFVAKGAS